MPAQSDHQTGTWDRPSEINREAADHHITPGALLLEQSSEAASMSPDNWSVYAYKSRHELDLFYKGAVYKTYHAVFGRSRWGGGKQWEGDLRTPEGNYLIVQKRRSARFRWFLSLNYPNAIDEENFEELRAAHEIPASARAGGEIGIHGSDLPILNLGDVNWTTGCISLDNADISELAQLLPVGTLVVIKP
jgi:murein L,D-transpeptidase YafK